MDRAYFRFHQSNTHTSYLDSFSTSSQYSPPWYLLHTATSNISCSPPTHQESRGLLQLPQSCLFELYSQDLPLNISPNLEFNAPPIPWLLPLATFRSTILTHPLMLLCFSHTILEPMLFFFVIIILFISYFITFIISQSSCYIPPSPPSHNSSSPISKKMPSPVSFEG